MNKDFHYLAIKAIAYSAGFSKEEAQIVAYASQYVDDACAFQSIMIKNCPVELNFDSTRAKTNGDVTEFDPICTAHKGLELADYSSRFVQLKVYMPFHFLPNAKYSGSGNYDFCAVPNGDLANRIVKSAIEAFNSDASANKIESLIKLGISLHTYADTWAHQRFSGRLNSNDNHIKKVSTFENGDWKENQYLKYFPEFLIPDIGHAEALGYPDSAYLEWKYYHCYSAREIVRYNYNEFLEAAFNIYNYLSNFTKKAIRDWKSLSLSLDRCFKTATDSMKELFEAYRGEFQDIAFDYDEFDWIKKALGEHNYDFLNMTIDEYKETTYIFEKDGNPERLYWYYFQKAAFEQRQFVLENVKTDLK